MKLIDYVVFKWQWNYHDILVVRWLSLVNCVFFSLTQTIITIVYISILNFSISNNMMNKFWIHWWLNRNTCSSFYVSSFFCRELCDLTACLWKYVMLILLNLGTNQTRHQVFTVINCWFIRLTMFSFIRGFIICFFYLHLMGV